MLDFEQHDESEATRVAVRGEVDLESAPELWERLQPLLKRSRAIRLDLSGVPYMDSTGVAVLVRSLKQAQQSGGSFRLVAPSERVRAVLDLAKLTPLFQVDLPG